MKITVYYVLMLILMEIPNSLTESPPDITKKNPKAKVVLDLSKKPFEEVPIEEEKPTFEITQDFVDSLHPNEEYR